MKKNEVLWIQSLQILDKAVNLQQAHVCLLQYIMNYNSKILLALAREKTQPRDNSGNILFQKNLSGF